jgi:hypothetical protein
MDNKDSMPYSGDEGLRFSLEAAVVSGYCGKHSCRRQIAVGGIVFFASQHNKSEDGWFHNCLTCLTERQITNLAYCYGLCLLDLPYAITHAPVPLFLHAFICLNHIEDRIISHK